MKRYIILTLSTLALAAGCVAADSGSASSGRAAKTRNVEFIASRPVLKQYGITLLAMERHFQSLGFPADTYSRAYKGQTLVITLEAAPETISHTGESRLKTPQGREVAVKDVCTIHYKRR